MTCERCGKEREDEGCASCAILDERWPPVDERVP